MKVRIATFLVLAVAMVAAWKARSRSGQAPADDPRAIVYEMVNAAKATDVRRYLSSFAEPMAAALERTVSAEYLREIATPLKGVALSDPQKMSAAEATIEVRFIYEDRTEAQTYCLAQSSAGDWKIARIEDAQRANTLVPYGTPVRLARRRQAP